MHDFAEQAAIAYGCRQLLATILHQGLYDEALARDGVTLPRAEWPFGDGGPTARELDRFWASDWFQNVAQWLDIEGDDVIDFARGIRDGTEDFTSDKRRTVRLGEPGPATRAGRGGPVAHERNGQVRQGSFWEAF